MKDLLEYIVKNLVSNPDAVLVDETNDDGMVNLELTVDPSDMGLVIGKGGQTIHAIRKLLTVRAITENVRVNLHLTEPAGGTPKTEGEAKDTEKSSETEVAESESAKDGDSDK